MVYGGRSVGSKASFQEVQYIHDQLLTGLLGTRDEVARILIGNKSDIEPERCMWLWLCMCCSCVVLVSARGGLNVNVAVGRSPQRKAVS